MVDGEKVRTWRRRRLMTLRELSAASGIAYDSISNIEQGKQTPRPSTVRRLAEALRIEPDELMDWDEQEKAAA